MIIIIRILAGDQTKSIKNVANVFLLLKNEQKIKLLVVQNDFRHPKNQCKLTKNLFKVLVVQNFSNIDDKFPC